MFLKPKFKVTINGKEEKKLFVKNINLNDYESGEIDNIALTLTLDSILPNFGDKIEIFMGREDYYFFGSFYVNAIKENYKRDYHIEAISINYKRGMKQKKFRSFENKSLEDILKIIARENGLKTRIDFKNGKDIKVIEQEESDVSLCNKLAKFYGCTFKIKDDTLIFIDIDKEYKRKEYNINADDAISLSLEILGHKKFNSVEVHFTDNLNNTHIIKVGEEEPTHKAVKNFQSKTQALQYAQSYLKKNKENKVNGELKILGGVFFAGAFLNLNLRNKTQQYLIKEVRHRLDAHTWESTIIFE
ncbi:hypothetical protein LW135_06765 [Helicobacter sp. faydin-H20]|uniref:phage late control D family protein n=1 Tax=Helicobacter anatolicus TaxID=2905874 RepID=UPI001E413557|nr:hypothetical protein [Helicobacter anatolicus]MCE3037521.1 hypothetical protein [Helicobacter anatolicus]